MFPAPTTTQTSTPVSWTATISPAIASTVRWSTPYSRPPISASPESLRSTRRKTGRAAAAGSGASSDFTAIGGSAGEREALELEHLGTLVAERLGNRLAGVVDPRLLGQHLRGEEALAEHALDDLLARLLGLRLHLVG